MWQTPAQQKRERPQGTYTKTELEDLGYKDIKVSVTKPVTRRRR